VLSGRWRDIRNVGYGLNVRCVELVAHTDNDGDELTSEGVAAAEAIGWTRLTPPYVLFGSTGARCATQMVAAAKGSDVEAIRAVDPDLVEKESMLLGDALRGVFDALPAGGRALVVGHGPTNEAAVLGLAVMVVGPLGKGEGVLIVEDGGRFRVRPMEGGHE